MAYGLIALALALSVVALAWRRARAAHAAALAALHNCERAVAVARTEVERLVAGLGGASDGLIVLDEQGHVVATNPAAVQLAALPGHDCRGARLEELVPWPRLHEALTACRKHGTPQSFDLDQGADGATQAARTLAIRVRVLPGLGVVIGIDDQSRLKRLESLRREFVANVSHELKTPLAAIQGFVETVQDDPHMPVATRHRFLERIARQTDRLKTLVADLLTLSRLDDEARLAYATEPCDFVGVARDTLRDLMPLAEKRDIEVTAQLPEQPLWVRADREALRQVTGNLVDNALKYTPERGTVTVRVTARADRLRFEVADTGIGLSPADQERVFERFYRVDRARSRELGGTGLGLSIVKNTVKNLGGDVGVRSELGVGSLFWVELPCDVVAPPPEG